MFAVDYIASIITHHVILIAAHNSCFPMMVKVCQRKSFYPCRVCDAEVCEGPNREVNRCSFEEENGAESGGETDL